MRLRRYLVLGGGVLFLFAGAAEAMTRAFFTSQESVEKELVRLIDQSHSTIDLALYRFASRPLALAISRAKGRHVRVRLVLDGHSETEGRDNHLGIAFVAGEVRRLDGKRGGAQGIMHHKFVLFDRKRVVTGSFNWTSGAEHVNYENALLMDSASVVAAYAREFERLWEKAESVAPGSMDSGTPAHKKMKARASSSASSKGPAKSPAKKKRRKAKKS